MPSGADTQIKEKAQVEDEQAGDHQELLETLNKQGGYALHGRR